MKLKILIVEDDLLLAEAVSDFFEGKGWEAEQVHDGMTAVEKTEAGSYQMILLDVMLPEMNGFEVCRKIRQNSDIPIFFITARVLEEDELAGYAAGADDYITKPFSLPALYAKIMAMMARLRGERPMEKLKKGGVEMDLRTGQVMICGQKCEMPPKEYELLRFFLENPDRIFTRDQLLTRLWGYDFEGTTRTVDTHIKTLRQKLGDEGKHIVTLIRSGYKFEVTP